MEVCTDEDMLVTLADMIDDDVKGHKPQVLTSGNKMQRGQVNKSDIAKSSGHNN